MKKIFMIIALDSTEIINFNIGILQRKIIKIKNKKKFKNEQMRREHVPVVRFYFNLKIVLIDVNGII